MLSTTSKRPSKRLTPAMRVTLGTPNGTILAQKNRRLAGVVPPANPRLGEYFLLGLTNGFPEWKPAAPLTNKAAFNAGAINFEATSMTVSESTGTIEFYVLREGGSSGNATAQIQLSGSAVQGVDFENVAPLNFSWSDGDKTPKKVVITLKDDTTIEATKTLVLSLTNVSGASTGTQNQTVISIESDDESAVAAGDFLVTGISETQFTTSWTISPSISQGASQQILLKNSNGTTSVINLSKTATSYQFTGLSSNQFYEVRHRTYFNSNNYADEALVVKTVDYALLPASDLKIQQTTNLSQGQSNVTFEWQPSASIQYGATQQIAYFNGEDMLYGWGQLSPIQTTFNAIINRTSAPYNFRIRTFKPEGGEVIARHDFNLMNSSPAPSPAPSPVPSVPTAISQIFVGMSAIQLGQASITGPETFASAQSLCQFNATINSTKAVRCIWDGNIYFDRPGN